ncbi:hypothetical protein DN752_17920 [Echinicola strongylocentroti]|uniref:Uncharacterized protein n=1 Tax=Echinicola strongylocentroti TaxID=1795355 RepID=A0A2Z4IMM2_9BACT|nr:hypothetical protein [Echinicola strongylocentroti]AWW31858.1 hypothetical protein DN752_17920 [Echinicola strongylocentroti]
MKITTISQEGKVLPNSPKTNKLAMLAHEVFARKKINVLEVVSKISLTRNMNTYQFDIDYKGDHYKMEATIEPDKYLTYKDQVEILADQAYDEIMQQDADDIL